MSANLASVADNDPRAIISALHALRGQPQTPELHARFIDLMRLLCRARNAVLIRYDQTGEWVVLASSPVQFADPAARPAGSIADIARTAMERSYAVLPVTQAGTGQIFRMGIRVAGVEQTIALMDLPASEQPQLNELAVRALLAADLAPAYAVDLNLQTLPDADSNASSDQEEETHPPELLSVLDLAAVVMQESRFQPALLALVNGLAARLDAEQVAVGWIVNGKVVTKAISHLDNFDRHAESVLVLEEAFEEVIIHDAEVLFSANEELMESEGELWPAHSALVDWIEMSAAMSVPLRDVNGITVAILTLVLAEELPTTNQREQVRLLVNIIEPWLRDLQDRDRNVIHRAGSSASRLIENTMGPGNVIPKALSVVGAILFLILVFGTWPFRVEATSQLTTDSTRVITSQFDGRIEEVAATAGDEIRENDVLAVMDTRELGQQAAEVQAEIARYVAEADRARASGNFGEMEIALARQSQAIARQQRLNYYVDQAQISAPFDGVVVEGERKELLGASVRKGDKLFRVARVEGLYLTLMVPERDIRHIQPNATGRLHLLSRPDQTIRLRLANLIPVAQVKGQEGNQFMIKAELLDPVEPWWRPGMSGVVRIDVGERNIGWILTHRLVDSLRMYFWW